MKTPKSKSKAKHAAIEADQDAFDPDFAEFTEWLDDPDSDPGLYFYDPVAASWFPTAKPKSGNARRTPIAPDWVTDAIADLPKLLTAAEAMSLLRMSQRHFYRQVARGRIHAIRAVESGSSRLLVPRASIEKYLRGLENP